MRLFELETSMSEIDIVVQDIAELTRATATFNASLGTITISFNLYGEPGWVLINVAGTAPGNSGNIVKRKVTSAARAQLGGSMPHGMDHVKKVLANGIGPRAIHTLMNSGTVRALKCKGVSYGLREKVG